MKAIIHVRYRADKKNCLQALVLHQNGKIGWIPGKELTKHPRQVSAYLNVCEERQQIHIAEQVPNTLTIIENYFARREGQTISLIS